MAGVNERVVNGVRTRVLHNKDYVEVAERVRIVHELKKTFKMLKSEPMQVADRWLWVCVIEIDGMQYIGNAEAKLSAPKNSPDGTNPFECAETSALGRALAFAGLGTVESIASYDEIARAQPFELRVEPVQKRVIDAPPAPKQIAVQEPSLATETHAERLNRLFTTGKARQLWTDSRTMASYVASLLETTYEGDHMAFLRQLTGDELTRIDYALASTVVSGVDGGR